MVEGPVDFDNTQEREGGQGREPLSQEEYAVRQADSERAFQVSRFEQNQLIKTPFKETVRWATREVMGRKESVTIASPSLEDRYGMLNTYQGMRARANALITGADDELVTYLGFLEEGSAVHRFKSLEIDPKKVEEIIKIDPKKTEREARQQVAKDLLGETEDLTRDEIIQRDALIVELLRGAEELEVREKFDDLWSLYLFVQGDFREFRRIPFAAENKLPVAKDFDTLFNLPATAEIGPDSGWRDVPESQKERMEGKLGERIDLGMRLYTIVALSERKTEFAQIRNTPGYREFVIKPLREVFNKVSEKIGSSDPIHDTPFEEEFRRLILQYGDEEDIDKLVEKVFIGDIDKWRTKDSREGWVQEVQEDQKDKDGKKYKKGERKVIKGKGPESLTERRTNRGFLTMHGNFFARKERGDQKQEINEAVKMILGGDESAQELARRTFYLVGEAPYYGAERDAITFDKDGKFVKQDMDREGAPYSDARERAMDFDAFMLYKQAAGEWAGPDIALGKYPKRLLTSFFRHVSLTNPTIRERIKELNPASENFEEEKEKLELEEHLSFRSIHELMWEGWDGETALRLGDVPWETMKSYAWKDYAIRLVFSAQLFDILTGNTDERGAWNERNFQSVKWWRTYATAARVSLGNWTVTDGRNKEWFDKYKKEIDDEVSKVLKDEAKKPEDERKIHTIDGAKKEAATALLKKQTKAEILKAHETLANSIYWWYGNIESVPREGRGTIGIDVFEENVSRKRVLAGILLPGEEPAKFGNLVRVTKKEYAK